MNGTVIGTDFYCPECKRRLVKMNEDGTFDLADKATVLGTGESDEIGTPPTEIVLVDAICLRTYCRAKRAFRRVFRTDAEIMIFIVAMTAVGLLSWWARQ